MGAVDVGPLWRGRARARSVVPSGASSPVEEFEIACVECRIRPAAVRADRSVVGSVRGLLAGERVPCYTGQRNHVGRGRRPRPETLSGTSRGWNDRLMLLDFDSGVIGVAAQPFWANAGRQTSLTRTGLLQQILRPCLPNRRSSSTGHGRGVAPGPLLLTRLRLGGGRTRFGHDLISVASRYPDIPGDHRRPSVRRIRGSLMWCGGAVRREERRRPYPGQPPRRSLGTGGGRINSAAVWPRCASSG